MKLYLPHFFTQQMGFLMQAAQQTRGQWTGRAQTKIPLQMAGMSSTLSHLVTVVSVSARGQYRAAKTLCIYKLFVQKTSLISFIIVPVCSNSSMCAQVVDGCQVWTKPSPRVQCLLADIKIDHPSRSCRLHWWPSVYWINILNFDITLFLIPSQLSVSAYSISSVKARKSPHITSLNGWQMCCCSHRLQDSQVTTGLAKQRPIPMSGVTSESLGLAVGEQC